MPQGFLFLEIGQFSQECFLTFISWWNIIKTSVRWANQGQKKCPETLDGSIQGTDKIGGKPVTCFALRWWLSVLSGDNM